MCSARPSLRQSIDGMQIKLRSCSKMKSPIHFRSRTIFLHGGNGRSTSNGCDIAGNSSDRLAVVASMNRVTICARKDFSNDHEDHEVLERENSNKSSWPL